MPGLSGLWIASYVILWLVVLVVCVLLLGMLRQLGLMQRQLDARPTETQQEEDSIPDLEHDGPAIGSALKDLKTDTLNGFGNLSLASLHDCHPLLLTFMSPLCDTCQHIVEPLNDLVNNASHAIRIAVIIRGEEQTCRAFLSVFPLHMPTICDSERTYTMSLDIHRTPFALLYNEQGILVRKGFVGGNDDLLALLGDASGNDKTQAHVFPQPVAASPA